MPYFGLGSYAITDDNVVYRAIKEIGVRAFDCASFYKNEAVIGRGINKAL
jgi:diketogulonate reductase-like aldo/keto reductase